MGTQRKIVVFITAFAVIFSFLSYSFTSYAASPSSLNIRRAWVEEGGNRLSVFLDCLDVGRSIRLEEGDLKKFTATLGDKTLDIEAGFPGDKNAIVFLVDVSNTLNPNSFSLVKQGVGKWLDKMKQGDKAAIISFGSRTEILSDFSEDIESLREALDGITQINKKLDDAPDSCLYQAVSEGMSMCNRQDMSLPDRRVVVAFTSGVRTSGGTTQETLRREIISKNQTPIYAILFDYAGRDIHEGHISQTSLRNQFIDITRESGGLADTFLGNGNASELTIVMEEQFARFDNLIKINIDISSIELSEGGESNLEISWDDGARRAADVRKIPFSVKPSTPEPTVSDVTVTQDTTSWSKWLIIGLGLIMALAIGVIWCKKKKKLDKKDNPPSITPKHEPELPPAPEIVLNVIGDSAHTRTYRIPFCGSVVIGRSSESGILTISGDEHISGKHCEIIARANRFMIRDLNSTNGTIVNGAALSANHPVVIDDGDIVTIGLTQLRVSLPLALHAEEPPTNRLKRADP